MKCATNDCQSNATAYPVIEMHPPAPHEGTMDLNLRGFGMCPECQPTLDPVDFAQQNMGQLTQACALTNKMVPDPERTTIRWEHFI